MDKLRTIYLELDDNNIVTSITESETPYEYCEVSEEVGLEEIVAFLELDKYVMKFENGVLIVLEETRGDTHNVIESLQKQVELLKTTIDEERSNTQDMIMELMEMIN